MHPTTETPTIACNLGALSPSERLRRSQLARAIQQRAIRMDESEVCEHALELILLEQRCCPFLSLQLEFEPGDGDVVLAFGGAPGVKAFLRDNGILGGAIGPEGPGCC